MSALRQEKYDIKYTYEDYCNFEDEGTRWELIDGEAYAMAATTIKHQEMLGRIYRRFAEHLDKSKRCKVLFAPIDVRLFPKKDDKDKTVLQPDLLVVCDPKKLEDGKACKGAPDLVIEILSPSNTHHDRMKKFAKYIEAKVKEIWFIDPETELVETFLLNEESGEYEPSFYTNRKSVAVGILPDLMLSGDDIFGDIDIDIDTDINEEE